MNSQKVSATDVKRALKKLATKERAVGSARFFKTGPGQYGEGDIFIGVTMPDIRHVTKQFAKIETKEILKLVSSPVHEERMCALLLIVDKYSKADQSEKKSWYDLFLKQRKFINNWDLVDVTVPRIVGDYLINHPRAILYQFVNSKNLWERRIAVLATFAFIREKDFTDALKISTLLLGDNHDLMHKAVGWMLREVGKRSEITLVKFLKKNYHRMPRTTLRYAIERFPESTRKRYLKGDI